MVRKTILLLLLLSALLFATGVVSAAQEYAAERYDVQIDVQEDSSLWITETVTFRFSGDPFTFVFRTLPTEKTDGISNIQASMDGMPLPIGTQPGQVEINTGDEVEVTWHFQPVSDSTHTFTLQYQAAGVVQQSESADLLEWDVFPAEHEYRIAQGTVMVNYPASAAMVEEPQVFAEGTSIQSGESQLSFSVSNLDEDETATLRLAFAPGSLIAGPPQWQARQMRQRQAALDALP